MRAINRKLVRDLWRLKTQAGAIALVMACGVATFVMSLSMLDSLSSTLDNYYDRARFADVFAHLERAPLRVADRIAAIPGVASVESRIVEPVILDLDDMPEPASGRIVSLPIEPRAGLNLLHLREGRLPEPGHRREALVSEGFATAHEIRPGDSVNAILNGRLESLHIVGIALSPEFIYLIPPGGILPEDARYAIFWMDRDEIETAFDMEGAFNDVVLRLSPGADEQEVIDRLDDLTARYAGLGAYPRADQASHEFVANEIRELRGMAIIVPVIFLGVAAFLLNIVVSRMVEAQREQIAALKALGYTNWEIGRHYLLLVLAIAVIAVSFGIALGVRMGLGLTGLYADFFNFPEFDYRLRPAIVLLAFGVGIAASVVGVAGALRAAMRLPPAEAMRPRAPASFRPTLLERLGLSRFAPPSLRMILREMERRPVKTALSCLGVALAAAILVVGSYTEDATDHLLDLRFHQVERYDIDVVLTDRTDDEVVSTLAHMPGVTRVEPYRTLSVRVRSGNLSRRTGVLGLSRGDGLHNLLNMYAQPVALPEGGVVLSETLAQILGLRPGDPVILEALEGRRPVIQTRVAGTISDFSGLAVYMRLDEVNRVMREPDTITGAFISADPRKIDRLYAQLRETPRVAAVNVKSATLQSFQATIAHNLGLMRRFLISFAVIIAFGVIYNAARISLSERGRDLATLRVLGFTRREIAAIQLGELAIVTGVGIPLGLVLGYALAWAASQGTQSELFRMPFVVNRSTFALGAIGVILAALLSGALIAAILRKLDLISVLKARE
ncbi:MAG: FtsX-like permease family protein [Phycisphaerales bacterium]